MSGGAGGAASDLVAPDGSGAPSAPRESGVSRGLLAMLAAIFLGGIYSACARQVGMTQGVAVVVFARFAGHLAIALALAALAGRLRAALRTRRPGLQAARSLASLGVSVLFFSALVRLPFTETQALFLTYPAIVALLAAPTLGERVGRLRAAGVALGLAGALVVVRPGADVFQPAALLALGAAFCYAVYELLTRRLAEFDPPETTNLIGPVAGAAGAAAWLLFLQPPPPSSGPEWMLLAAVGAGVFASHRLVALAFAHAPAALASGLGYASVPWAALLAWLLFEEFPDPLTWVGIAVICGGGLLLARSAP